MLLIMMTPAWATGDYPSEPKSDWYKSLMVPGHPDWSCCDQADCRPTAARYSDGHWSANIAKPGEMENFVLVPDSKIIKDKDSWDGMAYVCVLDGSIRCFVRPGGGA